MLLIFGLFLIITNLQNAEAHADVRIIIVSPNGEEFHLHRENSHLTFTSWLNNATSSRIKQAISYGICHSTREIPDLFSQFDGIKYTTFQLIHALTFGDFAYCKLLLEIAESHKQPSDVLVTWLQSTFKFPEDDMFRLIKNAKLFYDNFNTSYPNFVQYVFVYTAERYSLFQKAIGESQFVLAKWLLDLGCRLSELSSDSIQLLLLSGKSKLLKEAIENLGEEKLSVLRSGYAKYDSFLEFLIEYGFTNTLDKLLNYNVLSITNVLSKAIEKNNTKIIDKYIGGLSIDYSRNFSTLLLHSAVAGGHVETVTKLVDLGVSLDVLDEAGKTPLYRALELNEDKIVEIFIQGGANYRTNTASGKSLLSTAVSLGDIEMARKLTRLNASCLQPDTNGLTPLQRAIENNDLEMVTVLTEGLHYLSNITIDGKSLSHFGVLSASGGILEKLLVLGTLVDLPDKDQNTPLCIAAGMTDKMKILLLAEYGADINHKCKFGNTPLHFAISKCSFSVVRVLIALGANVNITNSYDQSPLYVAAMVDSPEITSYIFSKGGDIYFTTKEGNTLLHAAAIHGSTKALETLIGFGIDVNLANNAGETPIYVAVKKNKPLVADLLASKGANALELGPNGDTLLHAAVDFDSIEAMITLMKLGLNPETLNNLGESSVNRAILSNNYELVWKLINNAATLIFSIDHLILAASSGSLESLKALTDYLNLFKLSISSEDPETGWTPLSEAVKANHGNVVRFLIRERADIYFKSRTGNSLVHLAAINGSTETLKVLHEFGLPIDTPNKKRETPLWLAVKYGNFDTTKLLKDLGADIQIRCTAHWENASLLLPAAFSGNERIVYWLLSQGFSIDDSDILGVTALQEAAAGGQEMVVQLLLDNGADVDKADINGMTPLHKAAYNGHAVIAEYLVTFGASLNVQAVNFLTPLHQAATNGHLPVVHLLCVHKADLNAQDVRGWTSLHWAAYRGHIEVVRELISAGANINIKSIQGMTPLGIARNRKHKDVEMVLIGSGGIT